MKGRSISGQAAHETLRFERIYNARPERVFAAFADVPTRVRWGTPSPDAAIVYSSANFAVGGVDVSRCGARDDLRYAVTALDGADMASGTRFGMNAALDNLTREFMT